MEYAKLGNSDIEVSRFGIGTLGFGDKIDQRDADTILGKALDKGINLIDTADSYGGGESESALGRVLQGRRDRVVISTKFWNDEQHDRAYIQAAVEASLRRLQTDYIDIYQPHHPSSKVPVEEILETLDALVRQGKIRSYGLSNHWAWQVARVHAICEENGWHKPIALECCYNLLNRSIENEIVPLVKWLNMGLLVYGALHRGLLRGQYNEPGNEEHRPEAWYYLRETRQQRLKHLTPERLGLVERLQDIGHSYIPGGNSRTLAFHWLLSKPYVSSIILGGSKAHQFLGIFKHIVDGAPSPEAVIVADYSTRERRYQPYENQFVTDML